jgi:hypothetical protein
MTATRLRLTFAALVATLTAIALAVPAVAAAAEVPLTIEFGGGGEGTVGCMVNAGPLEECETEYPEGTEVTVVAEPEFGSEFGGWLGECDTTAGVECEVEMDGGKTVEAVFELEEFEVAVETEGSGEGVVECQVDGEPFEPCEGQETYPYGTELVLFAEPEIGSEFVEWEGDCSGVEAECELTVEEELSVTAVFEPEPPFELTIEFGGTGEGEVECEVDGGGLEECEEEYEEGAEVIVVAEPKPGSEFVEWEGECDSVTGNECEVEMNADKTVEAVFEPLSEATLTINKTGSGTGTVECKFGAGSFGACTSPQPNGTAVEVKATASAGSELASLSGTGSASGNCSGSTCSFTITANSSVTAEFNLVSRTLSVTNAGTGSGSVKCEINSGPEEACAASYLNGTSVKLKATAASGSTFAGFSAGTGSAAACATSPCTFTIAANSAVTATFTAESGGGGGDGGGSTGGGGSSGGSGGSPPPPAPSPAGTATAAATAAVKSGKAALKLSCAGGPCSGSLTLTAKVKQGTKTKTLVVGKASFSLASGASATINVKLSGPVKQELVTGKTVKAKLAGTGVAARTVKLIPPKKK